MALTQKHKCTLIALAATFVVVAIGLIYYFTTPALYRAEVVIHFSTSDNDTCELPLSYLKSQLPCEDLSSPTICDDLSSPSLFLRATKALSMQTEFRYRDGWRWREMVSAPMQVVYPVDFLDSMRHTLCTSFRYCDKGYVFRIHYGHWWNVDYRHSSHARLTLDEEVESAIGPIFFTPIAPIAFGSSYSIRTFSLSDEKEIRQMVCHLRCQKDGNTLRLSCLTRSPERTKIILTEMVQIYEMEHQMEGETPTILISTTDSSRPLFSWLER